MVTKAELDEILRQCDECAGEDSDEYYEHFQTCDPCMELMRRAEQREMECDISGECVETI
jgi:hypothetical protein